MHEPSESYPVIVEVTTEHIVWVEAESQAEAVKAAQDTWIGDLIDDKTTAASWWDKMREPGQWDWDTVYRGGDTYVGRDAVAHVEWHRHHLRLQEQAARRAACAKAGHPNLEQKPLSDGRRWCPDCVLYLPAEVDR